MVEQGKQIDAGSQAGNKVQVVMIEPARARTIVPGEWRDEVNLARRQFKLPPVMADRGSPFENQPKPGEWTYHMMIVPPTAGFSALDREHFRSRPASKS